jgi:hypothetical protein
VSIHSIAQARSPLVSRNCSGQKARLIVVGRHREVQAAATLGLGADGGSERVHRHALVEGKDRHAGVAAKLRSEDAEVGRLAGAGRAEQEGMAKVAHVQVQAERCRAVGDAVHQRRREWRVHRAGGSVAAGPDGARRQQIGQVHGVDQRPADVFHAVAGQAAEVGVHGVEGLDAGGEAEAVDGLFHLAGRRFQAAAILVHEHDDAGVVALRD